MIFLVILHVFVSLVLILVILLQAGKGGGLSEAFGGASQQLFGTKSSTFLNRATSVCAILFLITCLSLGILSRQGRKSLMERVAPEMPKTSVTEEARFPAEGSRETEGSDEQLPKPDETIPRQESEALPALP